MGIVFINHFLFKDNFRRLLQTFHASPVFLKSGDTGKLPLIKMKESRGKITVGLRTGLCKPSEPFVGLSLERQLFIQIPSYSGVGGVVCCTPGLPLVTSGSWQHKVEI